MGTCGENLTIINLRCCSTDACRTSQILDFHDLELTSCSSDPHPHLGGYRPHARSSAVLQYNQRRHGRHTALTVRTAVCVSGFSEYRSCRERTNNHLRCTRRLTPVDRASQNACMVLEEYHRPICLRCTNREGRTRLLAACPSLQTRRASDYSMALWP